MNKILYTKYSNQRKKEYRISTSIVQIDNNKKVVWKRALYNEGKVHLDNMYRAKSQIYEVVHDSDWNIADCKMIDDYTLQMEFITGKSVDTILNEMLKNNDIEGLLSYFEIFSSKIFNNPKLKKFTSNDGYRSMFGDLLIDNDWHAFDISNVDMVFSNLIESEKGLVITDYEWVYDFQIPIEFILFRSLYHCTAFSELDDSVKEKVYSLMHIAADKIADYEKMEFVFQSFVKGDAYDFIKLHELIDNDTIPLDMIYNHNLQNRYILFLGEEKIYSSKSWQTDISINCKTPVDNRDFKLILNKYNGIYKIKKIKGIKNGKADDLVIKDSNSDLIIGEDYYFSKESPYIIFENMLYEEVIIEYSIIEKNNRVIDNLIKSIIKEHDNQLEIDKYILKSEEQDKLIKVWKDRSEEYENAYKKLEVINADNKKAYDVSQKDCEEYKKAYEEYKKAYEEYKKAYETTSDELNKIHSTIIWKIGDKAKSVFRIPKN